jgi:hypothetical protein
MIIMDITRDKVVRFKITNLDLIKSIQLVIDFPNNTCRKFTGIISREMNEVQFIIPEMTSIIKNEIDLEYYLDVEDTSRSFHKLNQDTISFKFPEISNDVIVNKTENVIKDNIDNSIKSNVIKINPKDTFRIISRRRT